MTVNIYNSRMCIIMKFELDMNIVIFNIKLYVIL